jgi:outer membrane lipoprotein LolB
MRGALAAALVAGAVLLQACSTFAPLVNPERQYAGRFAVVTTLADKRDSGSGRFKLAVDRGVTVLDLDSPLGSTLARVRVDARGAHLIAPGDGGQREVHGANAEALTYEVLGWPVPVNGFRDWIDGRPVVDRPSTPSAAGGSKAFQQDGWTISVLERFGEGTGAPRRLLFERPEEARQIPAISLRLVLDEPPLIR